MGDKTGISWTDATWNPTVGCTIISSGCKTCYAMSMAARLANMGGKAGAKYTGLTQESNAGPVWNGVVRLVPEALDQPVRWARPRLVFVNSMSDVFHDALTDDDIDIIFGIMLAAPQHTYQVLTKRAERMRSWVDGLLERSKGRYTIPALIDHAATLVTSKHGLEALGDRLWSAANRHAGESWPPRHIWFGVSAENQETANERVPHLLSSKVAVRFVSAEPLLGMIDFTKIAVPDSAAGKYAGHGMTFNALSTMGDTLTLFSPPAQLDQIIVGGESDPDRKSRARPMHLDWARKIRDDCAAHDTAFYFKQVGHFETVFDRDRDDPDWRRCDVVAAENPTGRWLNLAGGHGFHGDRVVYVKPVGKARAGDLLDGVRHHNHPFRPGAEE